MSEESADGCFRLAGYLLLGALVGPIANGIGAFLTFNLRVPGIQPPDLNWIFVELIMIAYFTPPSFVIGGILGLAGGMICNKLWNRGYTGASLTSFLTVALFYALIFYFF